MHIIQLIAVFVGSEFVVYFMGAIPISIRRHFPRRLVLFQFFALSMNVWATVINALALFAKF